MSRKSREARRAHRRQKAQKEKNGNKNYLKVPAGVEMFKPKKGTNEFDILPYVVSSAHHPEAKKGEEWYQRTIWVHYNIGPDKDAVLCPRTIKKPCPICKAIAKMENDPDIDDDVIDEIKGKKRELFNIRDYDDDKRKLFEISYYNFGQLLDEELREGPEENSDFDMLEGGKTLEVRFATEEIGTTKYLAASRIDFNDRDEDYGEDALKDSVDLDKALNVLSYEVLEALFNGESASVEDAPPEEEELPEPEDEEPEDEEPEDDKEARREERRKATTDKKKEDAEAKKAAEKKEEAAKKKAAKKKAAEDKKKKEEAAKKKAAEKKEESSGGDDDGECPKGHTFGTDCDEYPEDCDSCEKWDACMDRKEELEDS